MAAIDECGLAEPFARMHLLSQEERKSCDYLARLGREGNKRQKESEGNAAKIKEYKEKGSLNSIYGQLCDTVVNRKKRFGGRVMVIDLDYRRIAVNEGSVSINGVNIPAGIQWNCIRMILAFGDPTELTIHNNWGEAADRPIDWYQDIPRMLSLLPEPPSLTRLDLLGQRFDDFPKPLSDLLQSVGTLVNLGALRIDIEPLPSGRMLSDFPHEFPTFWFSGSPSLPPKSPFRQLLPLANLHALYIDAPDHLSSAQMADLMNLSPSVLTSVCLKGKPPEFCRVLLANLNEEALANVQRVCCVPPLQCLELLEGLPNVNDLHASCPFSDNAGKRALLSFGGLREQNTSGISNRPRTNRVALPPEILSRVLDIWLRFRPFRFFEWRGPWAGRQPFLFLHRILLAAVNRQSRQAVINHMQQLERRVMQIDLNYDRERGSVNINHINIPSTRQWAGVQGMLAFGNPNELTICDNWGKEAARPIDGHNDIPRMLTMLPRPPSLTRLELLELRADHLQTFTDLLQIVGTHVVNLNALRIGVLRVEDGEKRKEFLARLKSRSLPPNSPFRQLLALTNLHALYIDAPDHLSSAQMADLMNQSPSVLTSVCFKRPVRKGRPPEFCRILLGHLNEVARANVQHVCCVPHDRYLELLEDRLPNVTSLHVPVQPACPFSNNSEHWL